MSDESQADPFAPPEISTEVCCIHCGETYDSWQIEWRVEADQEGKERGFWCCPVAGCDGVGFGFDILPTDPSYCDEHGGWVSDDLGDDDDLESLEADVELSEELSLEDLTEGLSLLDELSERSQAEPEDTLDDFPFSMN